ncbi:MAG: hypothetical protein RLO04_10930 [Limnobacter sp.]|uniref:hypothetical protein n=1 Tax=Limnobacter sp. TaxID=2003368 RepID=UPI0032EE7F73
MTAVLIIDPDKETRLALESQLSDSNQFARVLAFPDLQSASFCLQSGEIRVLLIDAAQAGRSSLIHDIKARYPALGVVLLRDSGGLLDERTLQELGGHAQTTRLAAPMEIIACVAKALVLGLKPGKRILNKFIKDKKQP